MAFGEPTFEIGSERRHPSVEEKETEKESPAGTYEQYQSAGGRTLSEPQYTEVSRRVAEGAAPNPHAVTQAEGYATVAGIAPLTPETIAYYAALRYQPDGQREKYGSLGDQQLLAEALRMTGETRALQTFITWNHIIFAPASPSESV